MADEEKKKHPRIKAVTEEVVPEETVVAPQEVVPEEEPVNLIPPIEEKEHQHLTVRETDNIDLNSKNGESGVFVKFFLVTFFATLLAFLLAGGIYVYLTGVRPMSLSQKQAATPTPMASSEPIPSSTPASNVDLTTFKINVLNGNGGVGVASGAKTVIEKAGFKVTNTGNADNFNFTDTMIQVKPSVSADIVAKLKNALSTNYSVKIGDPLSSTSSYDIVVTVGSK